MQFHIRTTRLDRQFISAAAICSIFLTLSATLRAFPAHADNSARAQADNSSKLFSVSPSRITYSIDFEKQSSAVKHFSVVNRGSSPIQVAISAPTDPGYLIVSPSALSPSGGIATIPGTPPHSRPNKLVVDIGFAPVQTGQRNATIMVAAQDDPADSAIVSLSGSAARNSQGLWVAGFQYVSEFQGSALEQSGQTAASLAFGSRAFEGPRAFGFDPQNDLWLSFDTTDVSPNPLVKISRAELAALKRGGVVRPKTIVPLRASGNPIPVVRSLAFDIAGNMWITDQGEKSIVEFRPNQLRKSGSTAAAVTISWQGPVPEAIRFDRANNLWVTQFPIPFGPSSPAQAWRYSPTDRATGGAATPGLILDLQPEFSVDDLAFDTAGNLWIAGLGSNGDLVEMFSASDLGGNGEVSPAPAVTLTSPAFGNVTFGGGGSCIGGIDFDRSGDLWVSIGPDDCGGSVQEQIDKFDPDQLSTGGNISAVVSISQNVAKTNLFFPRGLRFGMTSRASTQ